MAEAGLERTVRRVYRRIGVRIWSEKPQSRIYQELRKSLSLEKGLLTDLFEISFNEMQVIDIIEEYRNSPSRIDNMLVYDDGIVKGVINCKPVGDEVEICEFYVEPFFKGQGIGRKLLEHVIAESKESGKSRIFLWVLEENISARRFYEANGFHASGETCLVEGTDKVDMCYELMVGTGR